MTISLYSLAKKYNSTKRPTVDDLVVTLTGELKEPCSFRRPVVVIEIPTGVDLLMDGVNYASISDFGRWYHVTELRAVSGALVELTMAEDLMAGYRNTIGNSTQYVLRSASLWAGDITDTLYPVKPAQQCEISIISAIPWYNINGYQIERGWYVIGVQNGDSNAIGSVSYYALNQSAFQAFKSALFDTTTYTEMSFSQIEEPLYKSLYNPMQYIVSCMWFPIRPEVDDTLGTMATLKLGFFNVIIYGGADSECYKCKFMVKTGSISLPVRNHPMYATRGIYLNSAPYTHRTLYIPPLGSIELDTSKLTGVTDYPILYWAIDFVTGEVRIRVMDNGNTCIIGEGSGQLGVEIAVAQQTQDIIGASLGRVDAAAGAVGIAGGLLALNPTAVASGISSMAHGIASSMQAMAPNVSSIPARSSLLAGDLIPYDQTSYAIPVSDDIATFGRPLCQPRVINTMSGYIQTSRAHLEAAGALTEDLRTVCDQMDRGFYFE